MDIRNRAAERTAAHIPRAIGCRGTNAAAWHCNAVRCTRILPAWTEDIAGNCLEDASLRQFVSQGAASAERCDLPLVHHLFQYAAGRGLADFEQRLRLFSSDRGVFCQEPQNLVLSGMGSSGRLCTICRRLFASVAAKFTLVRTILNALFVAMICG